MIRSVFVLLLLIHSLWSQCQNPQNGIVFQDDIIPRIDIHIHPDSLLDILDIDNKWSKLYYHADFVFTTNDLRDTIPDIGFRLRGNTSRSSKKKSFKVSFNTFQKGRKYHGLEKLNLNGEHNDPSIVRSKFCFDLAQQMGLVASRANHVKLYINEEYFGLYINVEHIDEQFVKSRYGNNNGNLYKCLYPADLNYRGDIQDSYKEEKYGRRFYNLKTNKLEDDYQDLVQFVSVLNLTHPENFRCELESVFNVDAYIDNIVFDILTGNWDNYIFGKNNFYLYHNTQSGLMEYILYDLDNTLGIDWYEIDWAQRNIYEWSPESTVRPLYNRIMQDAVYRNKFSSVMKKTLDSIFIVDSMMVFLDRKKLLIKDAALSDEYRTMDYGFSYDDFLNSYTQDIAYDHVTTNLNSYIYDRYFYAYSQLELDELLPYAQQTSFSWNSTKDTVQYLLDMMNAEHLELLSFNYKTDKEDVFTYLSMNDNGVNGDSMNGDDIYTSLSLFTGESREMEYYYLIETTEGDTVRYPACGYYQYQFPAKNPTLVINEFLASNSTVNTDNNQEYDDWIELYNYGEDSIFLGNMFLTDKKDIADNWKLPNSWIQPYEYILFWADKDEQQGDNHTNFKLKAAGEYIGLYQEEGSEEFVLLDEIEFGGQEEDISLGRLPNGVGMFTKMIPSPKAFNEPLGVKMILTEEDFILFPNPSSSVINIVNNINNSQVLDIEVINPNGKIMSTIFKQNNHLITIPVHELPIGLYYLNITTQSNSVVKLFIKI